MNVEDKRTSQDPTFEIQGPMRVFLTNLTDLGGTSVFPLALSQTLQYPMYGLYIDSAKASIAYGPSGSPPPPWILGTDYNFLPAGNAVPPAQFPVLWYPGANTAGFPVGSAEGLMVANRGPAKVQQGATYTLDLPFLVGGTRLSLHLTITGVAGGSTVLPGFGLWNLGSNPNAWTYVSPVAFDGLWSLMLRSDDFFNYATLSLCYVGYSNTNRAGPMSRLVFSLSGSGMCRQPLWLGAEQAIDMPNETNHKKISTLDIFRASGEYRLVTQTSPTQ